MLLHARAGRLEHMAFRDELGANRARVEALQQRVAELEADNRALRERAPPTEEPKRRSRALPAIIAVMVVSAVGGTYALAEGSELGAALLLLGLLIGATFLVSRAFIEHVRAGFVLVLNGRRRYANGRSYRLVHDGWVLRMPFVELADRMDVRTRRCEVDVENAYAKGDALRLRLSGLIHLARAEPAVWNAVERFLAKPMEEVDTVAMQTLEGSLRVVLATTPSAEARRAPDALARAVAKEAEGDFEKLGLVLVGVTVEVLSTSSDL